MNFDGEAPHGGMRPVESEWGIRFLILHRIVCLVALVPNYPRRVLNGLLGSPILNKYLKCIAKSHLPDRGAILLSLKV
jgi:hypothetical protein